jgi:Putative Ig domain
MLPQGLILGSEGIAGTPVNAGSSTLNVLVTDSHGFTTTANHRITISLPGLGFATSSLPDAQVGALYTSALTALSANPPAQWSAISGLPEGLALNSSGQLAGTPKSSGLFFVSGRSASEGGDEHAGVTTELSVERQLANRIERRKLDGRRPTEARAPKRVMEPMTRLRCPCFVRRIATERGEEQALRESAPSVRAPALRTGSNGGNLDADGHSTE